MADAKTGKLIEDMLAGLAASGEKMDGLSLDDLKDAMSHPKAAEAVAEMMPFELASVKPGEPAPDFTLPWLPGSAGNADDALTLWAHFGDRGARPVALIFGSYT